MAQSNKKASSTEEAKALDNWWQQQRRQEDVWRHVDDDRRRFYNDGHNRWWLFMFDDSDDDSDVYGQLWLYRRDDDGRRRRRFFVDDGFYIYDKPFEFGRSGNEIIDQFIFKNKLKWIPYNKFSNIKYFDKGGFSIIYKATYNAIEVVLKYFKYFNNLNENLKEFLDKWKIINFNSEIINILGFTKNPDTSDYILIIEYANKNNLRKCLTEIANTWKQKLFILYKIINGLNTIHKKNLIHYDFHDGNILCIKYNNIYEICISDYLGSYQSAKFFLKENNICGVIPFIAPEVLKGEVYTSASDIYSFSMIIWEFISGILPFSNRAHNLQLALSICKGERPEIIENTPQCYIDLMKKCWNENPLKRPSAQEVVNIISNWIYHPYENGEKISYDKIDEELKSNIMEFINAPIGNNNLIIESHPQAYYTSRLLDFTSKEVNEILESKCLDCIVEDSIKSSNIEADETN